MTRRKVGYAKLGRSMPLSLARCGNLGGDVEMIPTVKLLAERHPDVDFYLIGRNTGEDPADVGLPPNVHNPWRLWQPLIRADINGCRLNHPNLAVDEHMQVREIFRTHTESLFRALDGMVMWLGQHGTTNTPLPTIKDPAKLTKPHDWATLYGSYLLQGINAWRDVDPRAREEVLLNADPRNYVKYRDAKWPWRHPVLTQYNFTHTVKHERYDDKTDFDRWYTADNLPISGVAELGPFGVDVAESDMHPADMWKSVLVNVYARLEVNGLVPGTPFGNLVSYRDDNFSDRGHFGLFINEARRQVNESRARRTVLRDWVLPLSPAFIHGTWSRESQVELGLSISPAPWNDYYPKLHSVKCTFTTPSSGSRWATTKPWEAFAAGTVCLFHYEYDDQDNILGDAPDELRDWLRVKSPEHLRQRVAEVCSSETLWLHLVKLQREHFDRAIGELRWLKMIEERLGL